MAVKDILQSFQKANPDIELLVPSSPGWSERRQTRGQAGQERKPLGIAIPKTTENVSSIVRWATSSGVEITVRGGGNDFYGRNVTDGGLIIDVRELNSVEVAADKKTATIGGGVIMEDMIRKFEDEGVVAPAGNSWGVGYVGWVTAGGYGPMENLFGMGFEGIVGAQIVNAKGEIVEATEEMLEGIRGMGGNLGVITSMTINVYPARKILSGMLVFEATAETIRAIIATNAKFQFPKGLTTHHFIRNCDGGMLAIWATWADPDLEKGQEFIDSYIAALPPVKMNSIAPKTLVEQHEQGPKPSAPWGGQRCMYLKEMSPGIVDTLVEAFKTMPPDPNMSWSMPVEVKHETAPPNCFGVGSHTFLSFSDFCMEEDRLAVTRPWNDALYANLRALDDGAVLEGSYGPLTRPGDRTSEQIFGDKWDRVKDLKRKYDPHNVFSCAVPQV